MRIAERQPLSWLDGLKRIEASRDCLGDTRRLKLGTSNLKLALDGGGPEDRRRHSMCYALGAFLAGIGLLSIVTPAMRFLSTRGSAGFAASLLLAFFAILGLGAIEVAASGGL